MDARDRLKLGCIALGLKQVEIAERIGCAKQEITRVASGKWRSGRVIEGIASVLGCTTAWLVDGTGPAPSWAQDCDCAENADRIASLERELESARMANALLAERLAAEQAARERAERVLADRAAPRGQGAAG